MCFPLCIFFIHFLCAMWRSPFLAIHCFKGSRKRVSSNNIKYEKHQVSQQKQLARFYFWKFHKTHINRPFFPFLIFLQIFYYIIYCLAFYHHHCLTLIHRQKKWLPFLLLLKKNARNTKKLQDYEGNIEHHINGTNAQSL